MSNSNPVQEIKNDEYITNTTVQKSNTTSQHFQDVDKKQESFTVHCKH